MISITRLYNRNGAYVEDADSIDFGKISASSSRDPQIFSLKVDSVDSISNIKLTIETSPSTDADEGFLRYYSSKDIITDFSSIDKKTIKLGDEVSIDNFGLKTSEYVYLWIDPQVITFRGDFSLRLKWDFDYVEASSSSSSSSSCQYGEYITISAFAEKRYKVIDCQNLILKFDLDYSDYATVFIDGDAFVIENNGGCMVVNDIVLCSDGICEEFIIGARTYSFCLLDYANFIVRIYREGDCSPFPHVLLTTRYDFLLKTGGRLLLLEDTSVPKDQLLMTDGETFWYVDETGFYLLD